MIRKLIKFVMIPRSGMLVICFIGMTLYFCLSFFCLGFYSSLLNIARRGKMIKLNKILFPTDFSRCANQALAHALYLAKQYQAELHMLHVTVSPVLVGDPRLLTPYTTDTKTLTGSLADMVEATEFPQLSHRYGVGSVPLTVVNDKPSVTGALPEAHFLDHILMALEKGEAT